jgi:hypothetical protein
MCQYQRMLQRAAGTSCSETFRRPHHHYIISIVISTTVNTTSPPPSTSQHVVSRHVTPHKFPRSHLLPSSPRCGWMCWTGRRAPRWCSTGRRRCRSRPRPSPPPTSTPTPPPRAPCPLGSYKGWARPLISSVCLRRARPWRLEGAWCPTASPSRWTAPTEAPWLTSQCRVRRGGAEQSGQYTRQSHIPISA